MPQTATVNDPFAKLGITGHVLVGPTSPVQAPATGEWAPTQESDGTWTLTGPDGTKVPGRYADREHAAAMIDRMPKPATVTPSTDDVLKGLEPEAKNEKSGWWDAISRFAKGVANNTVVPALQMAMTGGSGVAAAKMGLDMAQAHVEQINKSVAAYKEAQAYKAAGQIKQYDLKMTEAFGHATAAAVPFIGPAAAGAGEQIAEGDIAGGAGATTGLLLPFGVHPALKFIEPKVLSAADRIAGRMGTNAVTQMARAISPVSGANKARFGQLAADKAAPALLDDPTMKGWSRASLKGKVDIATDSAAADLNREYDSIDPKDRLDLNRVKDNLDAKIADLTREGVQRAPGVAEDVPGTGQVNTAWPSQTTEAPKGARFKYKTEMQSVQNTERLNALKQARAEIDALGDEANAVNLRKTAQDWSQGAKEMYLPDAAADALKRQGRGAGWADAEAALRDAMANKWQQLKPLNTRYSLIRSAQDVMEAAANADIVRQGRNAAMGALIGTGTGEMLAPGLGGGVGGALVGGLVGHVLDNALGGGATMQIGVARALNRMSQAIKGRVGPAQVEMAARQAASTAGIGWKDLQAKLKRVSGWNVLSAPVKEAIPEIGRRLAGSEDTGAIGGGDGPPKPAHADFMADALKDIRAANERNPGAPLDAATQARVKEITEALDKGEDYNRRSTPRRIGEGIDPPATWDDVRKRAKEIIGPDADTLPPHRLLGRVLVASEPGDTQAGYLANSIGRMMREEAPKVEAPLATAKVEKVYKETAGKKTASYPDAARIKDIDELLADKDVSTDDKTWLQKRRDAIVARSPLEHDSPAGGFEIYDTQTGSVVGKAATRKGAMRSVDQRDKDYGGVRYQYRPVKGGPGGPKAGGAEANVAAAPGSDYSLAKPTKADADTLVPLSPESVDTMRNITGIGPTAHPVAIYGDRRMVIKIDKVPGYSMYTRDADGKVNVRELTPRELRDVTALPKKAGRSTIKGNALRPSPPKDPSGYSKIGMVGPEGDVDIQDQWQRGEPREHWELWGAEGFADMKFRYDPKSHTVAWSDTPSRESYFKVEDALTEDNLKFKLRQLDGYGKLIDPQKLPDPYNKKGGR